MPSILRREQGNRAARRKYILLGIFVSVCGPLLTMLPGAESYTEKYRPMFHFSARTGWVGDPDGLIRHDGKYHLFWWGHAESTDLVHWKEQPYPMVGDDGTFNYFSGSVVLDRENTSGLGEKSSPPLVALYTAHGRSGGFEDQRLSVSRDEKFFRYYDGNPVLAESGLPLRDPDVFWHAASSSWIMLLVAPEQHKIRFYRSANLTTWEFASEFGGIGAQGGNWEVPNLFQLPVHGQTDTRKWVLTCGVGPNRMQYFTGDFDGTRFTLDDACQSYLITPDTDAEHANWADWGSDFYAARGLRDYDNGGRVLAWMGWMGNWAYARNVPTSWGKGAESIPRTLELTPSPHGYQLIQRPWSGLQALRGQPATVESRRLSGITKLTEFQPHQNAYELEAAFDLDATSQDLGLNLCVGGADKVVLGYDARNANVYLDRRASGNVTFAPRFAQMTVAPYTARNGRITFHVFVDQSSIEIFVGDGELVMTSLIFPDPASTGIELFARGGEATLRSFQAWELASIWN